MRYYAFFAILFIVAGLVKGQSSWQLKPDSMNLAILVSDYQTYAFEKGNFSTHQPCDNKDADSLPFKIEYIPPWDFGQISFLFSKYLDTLFRATIVWMGRGKIDIPQEFLPADSFKTQQSNVAAPVSVQYFNFDGPYPPENIHQQADSAWNTVKSLQVVKNFSQQPYRVGIYLYPPSVGAFQPSVAKWIIFLYQGKLNTKVNHLVETVSQHTLFLNFANKTDSRIAITYQVKTSGYATVAVYSANGVKVAELADGFHELGLYTVNFNAGRFAHGIYFCRVSAENVTDVKRMVIGR
jgi:hypothetical protein